MEIHFFEKMDDIQEVAQKFEAGDMG